MNNFPNQNFHILCILLILTLIAPNFIPVTQKEIIWKPLLSPFAVETVSKIRISTAKEEFEIQYYNPDWKITQPENDFADNRQIEQVLSILKEVECAFDTTKSAQEYGLDHPYLTMHIEEHSSHIVKIGDTTPLKNGNYLEVDGQTCRSKTEIATRIPDQLQAYLSKKILRASSFSIHSVEFFSGEIFSQTELGWMQIHPYRAAIHNEKFKNWLREISESEATEFSKTQISFEEAKRMTFTIQDQKKEIRLVDSGMVQTSNLSKTALLSQETKQLLTVKPELFFETSFLTQNHRNSKITAIVRIKNNNEVERYTPQDQPKLFRDISQGVFKRIIGQIPQQTEEIRIQFSDDTQLSLSVQHTEDAYYFWSSEEDVAIVSPKEFLP